VENNGKVNLIRTMKEFIEAPPGMGEPAPNC